MKKYWYAALIGAFIGLCGCQRERNPYYPIEGVTAYKGQTASSLFADNGMPNQVQNLPNNNVIWTYYNNYQPLGVGDVVNYNGLNDNNQNNTNCRVQILLKDDIVQEINSACR